MADGKSLRMDGILGLLNLHHAARIFLSLFGDRRVSLWLKLSAGCGLVYIFSPLDVVPDFITGIGLLDDLIIALLIMQAFVELVPRTLVEEHCAKLRIDPQRLFVDVPRTVQDAMALYDMSQRWLAHTGNTTQRSATAPPNAPPPAAPYSSTPDEPPPAPADAPYSRYSAYRKG